MPRTLRVAVDVGGTFTDICVLDERDGSIEVAKVPSTAEPIDGVLDGVRRGGRRPHGGRALLARDDRGDERADHAALSRRRRWSTTKGFRDVIEIRRGTKDDLWDTYKDVAPPYIRRRDRLEVTERIDYAGAVLEPLDEEEARRRRGAAAPAGRRDGRRLLRQLVREPGARAADAARSSRRSCPGVIVSTSSEVLPEIFEHERFSTTVANAVLAPLVGQYTRRLEERLSRGRLRRRPAAAPLGRRRDDAEER